MSAVRPSTGRGVLAALLSAVLAGAGQLYVRRLRRGTAMLAVPAALAIAVWALGAMRPVTLVAWLVRPWVLVALLLVNLGLLFFRLFAVFDAYELGRGPRRGRAWAVPVLALIVVFTLLPHALVAFYDVLALEGLRSVFGAAAREPAPEVTTLPPPPSTVPSTTESTAASTSTTTTTTTVPWEEQDRLNVLLAGSDSGPGRVGVRTDTMLLVSVGIQTGYGAVFGLPRNLINVPMPDGSVFSGLLNELYAFGHAHPDRFPSGDDPGATALGWGVGTLLGTRVDYFAMVDLRSFVEVVDALGGVTIDVPDRLYDPAYPHEDGVTVEAVDIPAGPQTLDGHLALAYARIRAGSDDYHRMDRQRCLVAAMLEQAELSRLLRALPRLQPVFTRSVTTDVSLEALPALIELGGRVDVEEVVAVRFIPPRWVAGRTAQGYPVPNLERIREAVEIIFRLPPAEAAEELELETLETACT